MQLTRTLAKDALLIDRFDRPDVGGRRAMVSALTILNLDEVGARYASYADLATIVRGRLSRRPQRGGHKVVGVGQRGAGLAPGKLGHCWAKPFHSAQKAIGKSGSAGRRGRGKMPL